jgi:DNA-binding GntR family transcriptional regulator
MEWDSVAPLGESSRLGSPSLREGKETRASVAERVVVALRTALFDGELEPGQQVNQYVWSERLGVSRAALREGLKILAASRLLEHDQNRGYFVANLSLPEMGELYWLRAQVEREVILACRRASVSEASILRFEYGGVAAALDANDSQGSLIAEGRFFFAIYDLSERQLLVREAKRLWDLAAIYRAPRRAVTMAVPEEIRRFRERKRQQLQAILEGDRFALAESVVSERRRMIEFFRAAPFVPTEIWPSDGLGAL